MQYCQWQNSQENFDYCKQKSTPQSFSSNSQNYQKPNPFHSPQLSLTKCQLSKKKIIFSPNKTIHLEPTNSKNYILFNQGAQLQYPSKNLKLNHSMSSTQSFTPSTSCFENEYIISPEQLSLNNGFDNINNKQSQSFTNYFQRSPFLDAYCTKNACSNNNNNNNFKQSKQFNNFVNHFSSPIQSIKTRFRKQSFNTPMSSVDEQSDYQIRYRAGSYQQSSNNHLQYPAKKKKIDERGQRKQKKKYKNHYKQKNTKLSLSQNENIGQNVFQNVVLDEFHDNDNHRITNEDLITTHQEQMKEEQNQSNNDDEFNMSEKEDLDNLVEITLLSTHKHNYGCSMIDTILDELENEDDLKVEKTFIQNYNQNKIITLNEFDPPSIQNLETKTDFDKYTTSKNSECESNYTFSQQQSQNSKITDSWQNMKQLSWQSSIDDSTHQQYIENRKNDIKSLDKITTEESTFKQESILEDQQQNSITNFQEDLFNSEKDLKKLLDEANQQIKNPQALFQIVQKLASQIRQKDQILKTMENDNSQFQIVSLSQIPPHTDEGDCNSIRSCLQNFTIDEQILKEQQTN